MANCPACGRKLHLYNWKQFCPGCNVNLIYCKSNERLLDEAEKAEIEHAKNQPGIDRAKASFFGSSWAIAKIALHVIALASVFIPLVRVFPSGGERVNVSAIQLFNFLTGDTQYDLMGEITGGNLIFISVGLLLLSAVMIIVCLACSVMTLGKHGKQRNLILNSIMFAFGAAAVVCFCTGARNMPAYLEGYTGGSLMPGAFITPALYLVVLVYNYLIVRLGKLKITHTPCFIGGLPAEEYFSMVEKGASELEIRKKMVVALTAMQEEQRRRNAEEEAKREEERAAWK